MKMTNHNIQAKARELTQQGQKMDADRGQPVLRRTLPERSFQQNLTEWAVKCAMCNDTVDPHPRFFTEAECHAFKNSGPFRIERWYLPLGSPVAAWTPTAWISR
jgi:hypothetical protein